MKQEFFKILLFSIAFCYMLHVSCYIVLAEEMQSTNYKIQADSINIGGNLATTSNYRIDDTVGEVATGVSTTTNYQLKAGYQQMQISYISLAVPSDITMGPNIETTGGSSDGSGSATVITDSNSGYILTVQANVSPALQSASDSFADYTPAAAGTADYSWSVDSSASEFGFTPEGSHIVQKFLDNGGLCNAAGGSDTSSACWYNLSTTAETIAQSHSANQPSGTATTLRFKAEIGSSHTQTAATYQATITLTAIAN
jgi:hypothetical protein